MWESCGIWGGRLIGEAGEGPMGGLWGAKGGLLAEIMASLSGPRSAGGMGGGAAAGDVCPGFYGSGETGGGNGRASVHGPPTGLHPGG
jgi:hypothetical protein